MSGDDLEPSTNAANEEANAAEPATNIFFGDFLSNVPPGQSMAVEGVHQQKRTPQGRYRQIITPDLTLHCTQCEGTRIFRYHGRTPYIPGDDTQTNTFLTYLCSNCRTAEKMYALHVSIEDDPFEVGSARCYKFGELPPYGDPTPNRLLRLFGKDSHLFLKGRQCENHALGIGAFVYYRRVVESHKDQIFEEIIKAARKVAPDLVERFTEAKKEQQFLAAIEAAKDAIPQALLIDGHNPLKLLHRALSEGLHAKTDEQCLELAHHVRIVLADLVDRLGQVLKDDTELKAAISRLMNRAE